MDPLEASLKSFWIRKLKTIANLNYFLLSAEAVDTCSPKAKSFFKIWQPKAGFWCFHLLSDRKIFCVSAPTMKYYKINKSIIMQLQITGLPYQHCVHTTSISCTVLEQCRTLKMSWPGFCWYWVNSHYYSSQMNYTDCVYPLSEAQRCVLLLYLMPPFAQGRTTQK